MYVRLAVMDSILVAGEEITGEFSGPLGVLVIVNERALSAL